MENELLPVYFKDGKVCMVDQIALPERLLIVEYTDYRDVADAITTMIVRGAPSIGVAAALGIAVGARELPDEKEAFFSGLAHISADFARTRPTAVNLFWAIDEMNAAAKAYAQLSTPEIKERLINRATSILEENFAANQRLGSFGEKLLKDGDTVLTHCNAGGLAAGGYGTALGVIRAAVEGGKRISVISDETRPRLQGMRLTVWELMQMGVPVTAITDNMAAWAMASGMVDCVIVGADRIAANGDVANKVGTYGVAVLARAHGIPFYVAAPISTIDFSIPDGSHIPIEERCEAEVTHIGEARVAPEGVRVCNPSFDVTPNEYVSAIITEEGVLTPPYEIKRR